MKQKKQGIDWSKKNMFDAIGRQDLKKKWGWMLDSAKILEQSLRDQMDRDSGKCCGECGDKLTLPDEKNVCRGCISLTEQEEHDEISDNKIRSKHG